MNYYEQFYDDLDLIEYDDAPPYGREPYPYDDRPRRYRYDEYDAADYVYRDRNDGRYRDWDVAEREWVRDLYERERDVDYFERGRRPPPFDENYYERGGERREFGPDRGRGYWQRGRGQFSRGRGLQDMRGGGPGRGRGGDNIRSRGSRGVQNRGRGQGNGSQKGAVKCEEGKAEEKMEIKPAVKAGGIYGLNFVKEGESSTNAGTENETSGEKNASPGNSDTLRFDYKSYRNQRTETEKEVEMALKAYSCQLGFGYGYGPRSDLIDGTAEANWMEQDGQEMALNTPGATQISSEESSHDSQSVRVAETKQVVKKGVISPACNFVKARSEFKSTDVAFRETEKEEVKPKPNYLSVNMGNKRIGLGFGKSAASSGDETDISETFYAGMKGAENTHFNRKFAQLHEAVKLRNAADKNGIEVLHMAAAKVKMVITDDIKPGGRTPTGQTRFLCRLLIDGVYIAEGLATAKKAAKHEAFSKGVQLLMCESPLIVKEVSKGVFELKVKESEFKVPTVPGLRSGTAELGQGQVIGIAQEPTVQVLSKKEQLEALSKEPQTKSQSKVPPTFICTKPKIVFHKSSHPLENKPLEFKTPTTPPEAVTKPSPSEIHKTENSDVGSPSLQSGIVHNANQPSKSKLSGAEMALKLLNFVKAGESASEETPETESSKITLPSPFVVGPSPSKGHRMHSSFNEVSSVPRKRPFSNSGDFNASRLKVKKANKSGNTVLEDLSEFIIIDASNVCTGQMQNELTILHNSANFNRVVLKVEYEICNQGVNCSFLISDQVVATAHGGNKELSKVNAAKAALEELREMCYTIKVKQEVDNEGSGLTKEQLLSDIQKGGEMLPDSNVGNMLLRKMGWVGGGVGKDGQGIAEPVKAEMVIGREGLGLKAAKGIGKEFNRKVTKLLEDYLKSDEQKDLHFSSELAKEERAIIHTIGQKMGLKTHSKGKCEDRYLIVSRKRSAQELLDHVIGSGGSTSKYEVIPPADADHDCRRKEDIVRGHYKQ